MILLRTSTKFYFLYVILVPGTWYYMKKISYPGTWHPVYDSIVDTEIPGSCFESGKWNRRIAQNPNHGTERQRTIKLRASSSEPKSVHQTNLLSRTIKYQPTIMNNSNNKHVGNRSIHLLLILHVHRTK